MSVLTEKIAARLARAHDTRAPTGSGFYPTMEAYWSAMATEAVAVVREVLLSDEAIAALMLSKGDEAQCCPGIGGCGGTHTDCYYAGKMTAVLNAVTEGPAEEK